MLFLGFAKLDGKDASRNKPSSRLFWKKLNKILIITEGKVLTRNLDSAIRTNMLGGSLLGAFLLTLFARGAGKPYFFVEKRESN